MRAAVFVERDAPLVVEDVTPVPPGSGDVVVRVTASGVCHSDLSVINGALPVAAPAVLGHEGTGVVEWVGPEVGGLVVGDRVVGSFIPACGSCWYCHHGESHLCEHAYDWLMIPRARRADGSDVSSMTGLGTFAEQMTCAPMALVKVDTDLPDEQLALIGCGVTTGVGAVLNTAGVRPGEAVAVVGCGGVGQAVIQGARLAGAARIIAIDLVPYKLEVAATLGATDTILAGTDDVAHQVRALTGGRGVDYAFEVIGTPATVALAFDLARPGGAAVAVGASRSDQQLCVPSFPLVLRNKRLLGSTYGSAQVRRDFPRMIELVESGRLDVGSLVTRTLHLDSVNDALRAMQAGEVIRSVLV